MTTLPARKNPRRAVAATVAGLTLIAFRCGFAALAAFFITGLALMIPQAFGMPKEVAEIAATSAAVLAALVTGIIHAALYDL